MTRAIAHIAGFLAVLGMLVGVLGASTALASSEEDEGDGKRDVLGALKVGF